LACCPEGTRCNDDGVLLYVWFKVGCSAMPVVGMGAAGDKKHACAMSALSAVSFQVERKCLQRVSMSCGTVTDKTAFDGGRRNANLNDCFWPFSDHRERQKTAKSGRSNFTTFDQKTAQ